MTASQETHPADNCWLCRTRAQIEPLGYSIVPTAEVEGLKAAARPFATPWSDGGKMPLDPIDWPPEALTLRAALGDAR